MAKRALTFPGPPPPKAEMINKQPSGLGLGRVGLALESVCQLSSRAFLSMIDPIARSFTAVG